MKNFYIVTKDEKKENLDLIGRIRSYVTERGAKCSYGVLRQDSHPLEFPSDIDVILTVGGDGTLIRAADQSMGSCAPLIGINRGHLGYLCDLDESNLEESLQVLLDGSYELEERMLLTGCVYDPSGRPRGDYQVALNDVVISSSASNMILRDPTTWAFKGVIRISWVLGSTMGPPAERL